MSNTLILKATYSDKSVQHYEADNWKQGWITAFLKRDGLESLQDLVTDEVVTSLKEAVFKT